MIRIGIDVGGTNTDAVLVNNDRIIATIKTLTTPDITSGIKNALQGIVEQDAKTAYSTDAVIIGTTHFVNAVAERKHLNKVAAVRLCLPASNLIPPFADWPTDLRDLVRDDHYLLPGGFEVDGREIASFDDVKTRDVAKKIADSGVEAVAISSIFSLLREDHEVRASEIIQEICPHVTISCSKDLGRVGLLERENVALLNASLANLAKKTITAFRESVKAVGLEAKLYLTQNDGTVTTADVAEKAPVFCFSSGPTNSMRGAAFLSGLSDAIVVDVGGTTSDFGVLKNGFPREANSVVEVGGVRTLFRMPDVLCLPLGGGTLVHEQERKLGPDSVGFRLVDEAIVFGGNCLTTTDTAARRGRVSLGDASLVESIDIELCEWVEQEATSIFETGIELIKANAAETRLIVVGGGSFLVPAELKGISEVIFVEHHTVANAVGAALAQISGDVDQVFSGVERDDAIAQATEMAHDRATRAGADPSTLQLVEIEDIPLAYMAGDNRRIRVRVAGNVSESA